MFSAAVLYNTLTITGISIFRLLNGVLTSLLSKASISFIPTLKGQQLTVQQALLATRNHA
jgi:hypothetical protein